MNMTHYMELLANNQPWNLILFMAIPVGLAETVVITELYILFTRRLDGWVRRLNRWAGIVVGLYFAGIIVYLLTTAVLPITAAGQWRTALDVVAVGAYLLGGIPLLLVALQDLGLFHRRLTPEQKLGWHATYVAAFLILGHVAMIFGMADPGLLGYKPPSDQMHMEHSMPMEHGAAMGGDEH
ncbi:MAG: hypothetical protein LBV61_00995 [Burkholderiaceae bacterium]|jgi:hypothetical protein|nr:hypothetical protein [Burkholderiaceae bacterium]